MFKHQITDRDQDGLRECLGAFSPGVWRRICFLTVLLLTTSRHPTTAAAQDAPDIQNNPLPASSAQGNLADFIFKKTPYEYWLTLLIVAFGLLVIILYIFAIRDIKDRQSGDVSRAIIVITVITGSLVMITAGYSNTQIAPAFGLFGTIIGYMLGRMGSPTSTLSDIEKKDARKGTERIDDATLNQR